MKIDLDTIMDYCKGDTQTEQARDTMLRAVMAMNVLFRQDPAQRFTMSGAAGRKFFTDGEYVFSLGILICSYNLQRMVLPSLTVPFFTRASSSPSGGLLLVSLPFKYVYVRLPLSSADIIGRSTPPTLPLSSPACLL